MAIFLRYRGIRIPPTIRMPDQSRFITGYAGFTIEQGNSSFDYRDTRTLIGDQGSNPIVTQGNQALLTPTGGNQYSLQGSAQYIGAGHDFRSNVPRVDLNLSKDGALNYGNVVSINMRPQGKRQNRLMWWRLGQSNELSLQYRFYGLDRFVMTDGIAGVYQ